MNRVSAPSLLSRPRAVTRPAEGRLIGIIDIGSNSVRLVVYRGAVRVPPVIFNEKVMCGLARGLAETGRMADDPMQQAMDTLRRFALLCHDMGVEQLDVVATAAVRAASNGAEFVAAARRSAGLEVRVVTGEQEGELAALGVLSAIPEADGVVGDLGGGSLELARVGGGAVLERVSLPIGVLTLMSQGEGSPRKMAQVVQAALDKVAWLGDATGLPFYTVGGSWRALAHLDMHLVNHPLRVIHHYAMVPAALERISHALRTMDKKQLKAIPSMTERRLPSLPVATLVLGQLVQRLQSTAVINSAFGLREGILYQSLPARIRRQDPLLAACRMEAALEGRFPEHADALMTWMEPVFGDGESEGDRRLRHAACLLADVAWRGHPDFRAERALDSSLFGNWVGIDGRGRAMIGTALYVCYGASIGERLLRHVRSIVTKDDLALAERWGLALRLGQRLTAGTARPLADSRLFTNGTQLVLALTREHADLYGEVVDRRLRNLAERMGLQHRFEVVGN